MERLFAVIRDHFGMNVRWAHARLARRVFRRSASVRRCDGSCCRRGTIASLDERDRILSSAAIVSDHMTSRARHSPRRWFGRRVTRDDDFSSGYTVHTRVEAGACVFYRRDGLCALQVAGETQLGSAFALKPALCILWPLCVQDQTLDVGYAWFTRRRECCAPVRNGERTILDVIRRDEHQLRMMALPRNSRGAGAPPGMPAGRPS